MTQYDSNRTVTEDERYGELLIEHYGWGNSHLNYSYGTTELENRWCTDEDLGIKKGPKTRMFDINDRLEGDFNTYRNKFKCIDEDNLVIWGNYNSGMAMQLAVKFHMCSGHEYCKTKDEIRDWLSGKYIVLLFN